MKILGNKLLLIIIAFIIGGFSFVLATAPVWVGSNVDYQVSEDSLYTHDLSNNITGYNSDVTFAIDSDSDINWTNSTGNYQVTANDVSSWILLGGTDLGISADADSECGFFEIPIQATNITDSEFTGTTFEFMVNATNDAPSFSLDNNYSVSVPRDTNTTKNITLIGSDEESQYPLNYNVSFNNCSFAQWSTRTNADCSLPYNMFQLSNTTTDFALYNLSHNDVGEYNLTICANDNVNGSILPLYRVSDYAQNKTTCYNTTLNLYASLFINASDCNNTIWQEGETISCWVNISTVGASDLVDVSSSGIFKNDGGSVHNSSWFYAGDNLTASSNLIAINMTVANLWKEETGNWTVTISADDGVLVGDPPRPVTASFSVFVNYSESPVNLGVINNVSELYENTTFQLTVTDDDLLIWDNSVKKETLSFVTNESWVSVTNAGSINSGDSSANYRTADVLIDHDLALNTYGSVGNYSVQFNVTDGAGNVDTEYFVVEVLNDTAPEWNGGLSNPVLLQLIEDDSFFYNLSKNVTDVDTGDAISFYFGYLPGDFCSLNPTNFLSMGNISFTPVDCDVGFHNVTITASDGKINSTHIFSFNVSNVHDTPVISNPSNENSTEGIPDSITIQVDDEDYNISSLQVNFYNESLNISTTIQNITPVTTPISFSFSSTGILTQTEFFQADFTPEEENVGLYNVTINITDASGLWDFDYFTLNISQVNDAPNLSYIPNQKTTSLGLFYYDVNATDEEDSPTLPESGLLNYTISNLTIGGDFLTINSTTGIINVTMSESLVGTYTYNVTVNDSEGRIDFQEFNLTVYGLPNITSPNNGTIFNFSENGIMNISFNVSYAINLTNLSYAIYLDRILFSDSVNYSYSNLTLRDTTTSIYNSSNFTSSVLLDYSDETYGMLKNLTLVVYNTQYPELNDSASYKLNVTHTNSNISFSGNVPDQGPISVGSTTDINLSEYFTDVDYFDPYYSQNVNFSITTVSGTTYVQSGSSFSVWTLTLSSVAATVENIRVDAREYDNGTLIGNASSDVFEVEFVPPTVVEEKTEGTSGGGSTTLLKHFSLKLIMPQDIILSDNNYIDVPFSVKNTGDVTLNGINLDSSVRFNNIFSDNVKVTLQDTYIPTLVSGQVENYTLRIETNTQKSGKYKVTVTGNVTSPKFSDWGEFFITLQKTNESEAKQILLFTEQFLADNPECIELTEILNRAFDFFQNGEIDNAVSSAQEATVACEDAILANEQIRYSAKNFVEKNFYFISFIFLGLFVGGLVFYIYKRVRFNKYKGDYY